MLLRMDKMSADYSEGLPAKVSGMNELANPLPVAGAISRRFRGFLPVVVDVETGGFNCKTDALLEIAVVSWT